MVGGNAEERLPTATRERLDALLRPKKSDGEENAVDDAQGEAAGARRPFC